MNILHVNLASGFGGGENQTLELIKTQKELGYINIVIANPKSPFFKKATDLGVSVYSCKSFLLCHRKTPNKNIAIIHAHEAKAIYWSMIHSLIYKIPYIITRRIDNPLKNKKILYMAYERSSAVIGLSREIINQVKIFNSSLNLYKVSDSAVKYQIREDLVKDIESKFPNKFLIMQAGNFITHKAFDITIEAAKSLKETAPDIQFILLGDGPENKKLRDNAQGFDNIYFAGKIPTKEMGNWFKAANLQVHPSHNEGMGSVILEGMLSGLTVIGSRVGGIVDIIQNGENGILINPNNSHELSQAIINLYQNKDLREMLEQNAVKSMGNYSATKIAKHYEEIYQKYKL